MIEAKKIREHDRKEVRDTLTDYEFEVRTRTWNDDARLNSTLSKLDVSTNDPESYEAVRGGVLAFLLTTSWNRTQVIDGVESPLPITWETCSSLPPVVTRQISAYFHESGKSPRIEDLLFDLGITESGEDSAPSTKNT